MLDIGIVISTTRPNRFGDRPAALVREAVDARDDLRAEILDLRDHRLPFFEERASSLRAPFADEAARRWQRTVARFDGFVFVTAEYNHGVPAVLKNALDHAYTEWNHKPAAYFGYGSVGAARAVEQLRLINVELRMAPLRSGVHLQGSDFFRAAKGQVDLASLPYLESGIETMLDELTWWGHALQGARQASEASPSLERAAA